MGFFQLHPAAVAIALYWIFSAAVSALPPIEAFNNVWYTALHSFLHTLAGNITTALGDKIPGVKKDAT